MWRPLAKIMMKQRASILWTAAFGILAVALALSAQTQTPAQAPAQAPEAQAPSQSAPPASAAQAPATAQPSPAPVGTNDIGATPAAIRQSGEDPDAVARGAAAYASAGCGSCHGPTARGTDTGPDLVRSPLVEDDTKGELIGPVLSQPHPKGGQKPNLTEQQISDVAAWLRVQVYGAAMRDTYQYLDIVVGDPQKGEAFFNGAGKCASCHSVTGDLKGIGSKYDVLTLQGRIILPRGKGGWPNIISPFEIVNPPDVPKKVTVTEPDGIVTTGDMISISDFDVVLRDDSGIRHTFARNGDVPKVVVTDPLQAHIDLIKTLTDKEMHDLTAYLVTLK